MTRQRSLLGNDEWQAMFQSLPQAEISFIPDFLSPSKSDELQLVLRRSLEWEQSTIKLFGRSIKIPRLNAFYGDAGCEYQYSGKRFQALAWSPELLWIKQQIERETDQSFNCVLVNCYRDGQDSMGWHSDDEPELGQNPVIASISLGQTREFQLKHKQNPSLPLTKIPLSSGSLLIMKGTTQHYWQHQIPKTRKQCGERINLTFRRVIF